MYSLALIIYVVSEKMAFEHFPTGSCDGGHLRFPIGIKNRNLVKDVQTFVFLFRYEIQNGGYGRT
jgi:hypothetical protein